jgi:Protein of unknown function (DUF3455)
MRHYIRPIASIMFLATATLFCGISLPAQQGAQNEQQEVPQALQPPIDEKLLLQAHARGDQIYSCKSGGGQFMWTLKAPDAQLFDIKDQLVGKHLAGPSWQSNDGSRVVGKVAVTVASPDAESIPWLLVKVTSHTGNGVLARATTIQRLNTEGGKAPGSGCDEDHVNQEIRVPYSADYFFYGPK